MHRTLLPLSFAVTTLTGLATAQQALATTYGTLANGELGTVVRGVGDIDGDGVPDFAVSEGNHSPPSHVFVISGATHATLTTLLGVTYGGFGYYDINPIGDVDGDGSGDLAVGYGNRQVLDVFSGATGARLYSLGPALGYTGYTCTIGDYDGDGRADFAASLVINNVTQIWLVRGLTGTQLAVLPAPSRDGMFLRNLGDITGDGRPEIASCGSTTDIYDLHPVRLLRSINLNISSAPAVAAEAADMNRDGRSEVLVSFGSGRSPFLYVLSAVNGTILRSMTAPPGDTSVGGYFSVLSDIDGDGVPDLVLTSRYDPLDLNASRGVVALMSGLDGRRLGAWAGSPQFPCDGGPVAGVGDVDGDGVGDFAIGNSWVQSRLGGWQLVSGRVLANMLVKPANCYAGPFAPQLGVTRPVLGQTMTVAGRDAPAPGLVMLGFLPMDRTNLGVVGCDLWFDPLAWSLLGVTGTSPSWQFGVALPNQVGLRGVEVALQVLYPNAAMPVGLELSNGVWARLGD